MNSKHSRAVAQHEWPPLQHHALHAGAPCKAREPASNSPPADALAHRPAVILPVPLGELAPMVTDEAHMDPPHTRPTVCLESRLDGMSPARQLSVGKALKKLATATRIRAICPGMAGLRSSLVVANYRLTALPLSFAAQLQAPTCWPLKCTMPT